MKQIETPNGTVMIDSNSVASIEATAANETEGTCVVRYVGGGARVVTGTIASVQMALGVLMPIIDRAKNDGSLSIRSISVADISQTSDADIVSIRYSGGGVSYAKGTVSSVMLLLGLVAT